MAAQEVSVQEKKELEAKLQDQVEIIEVDLDQVNMSPNVRKEGDASLTGSTQSSMVSLE